MVPGVKVTIVAAPEVRHVKLLVLVGWFRTTTCHPVGTPVGIVKLTGAVFVQRYRVLRLAEVTVGGELVKVDTV